MKYIVILGDGMADYPVADLSNRTPLQAARKPSMDYIAAKGILGMVKTVPDSIAPGSDVANLSVIGYNPLVYYTGRSPIEAVSIGIDLLETDVAVRCNLVTLSDGNMADYSSDEISTEESAILMKEIETRLGNDEIKFYPGMSYRHCMIWKNGSLDLSLTPPHDITGKKFAQYLPQNKMLRDLMSKSYDILKAHPVNLERIKKGLNPANSVWLWGEGTKLSIPSFKEKYNLSGAMISAVDLLKGIGISAGLKAVNVPGATGNIHTDFGAKKRAAVAELKSGKDFVFIHIEAPDECGHRYEIENKVRAIELIDEKILTPLMKELDDYRILLLPDHPTPLSTRTHTSDPVPFVIYDSGNIKSSGALGYDEKQAEASGIYIAEGYSLMDKFIKGASL